MCAVKESESPLQREFVIAGVIFSLTLIAFAGDLYFVRNSERPQ